MFYDRSFPSVRSCMALLLITSGAGLYIMTDREFQIKGMSAYYWVMIWWVVLVFQLTYGKFLVSRLPLASLWTPVLYTNTFSILPALFVCFLAREHEVRRLPYSIHLYRGSIADAVPTMTPPWPHHGPTMS